MESQQPNSKTRISKKLGKLLEESLGFSFRSCPPKQGGPRADRYEWSHIITYNPYKWPKING